MFPVSKYGQSYAIFYGPGFQTNTESVCIKHTHYLNNSHLSNIYSQYFIQKIYCIIQFSVIYSTMKLYCVCAIFLIKAIKFTVFEKKTMITTKGRNMHIKKLFKIMINNSKNRYKYLEK